MLIDNFSNGTVTFLYKQAPTPVLQNRVYLTQQEALEAICGEIELVQSNTSGFVFNAKFDSSLIKYDQNYQNEQAHSKVFQKHLQNVLELLKSWDIQGKKVVEIGCGKGYFLQMLLHAGISCIGFDPAYEGESEYIIKDFFNEKSSIKADVIILRHTLEHIPNPFTFLHQIASANSYEGNIFIEVPTFDWIANKKAFWDIFYEHCNYFTEETLSKMFVKAQTGSFFGGQYIYLWAKLADLKNKINDADSYTKYTLQFDEKINTLKKQLSESKNAIVWGAGAKGTTFVNLLDPHRTLFKFVVDINPEKQNKFIAKTGHLIVSPDVLQNEAIKDIWVMNENYLEEIQKTINNKDVCFHVI